jgi:hypothetical protein
VSYFFDFQGNRWILEQILTPYKNDHGDDEAGAPADQYNEYLGKTVINNLLSCYMRTCIHATLVVWRDDSAPIPSQSSFSVKRQTTISHHSIGGPLIYTPIYITHHNASHTSSHGGTCSRRESLSRLYHVSKLLVNPTHYRHCTHEVRVALRSWNTRVSANNAHLVLRA